MRWLILVLSLLAFPSAAQTRDAGQHFFQPFLGDLAEDLVMARDEGRKGILLMFEMEECPWCHRMKQTILNQVEVQDYFRQHFLIYSIDVKGDAPLTDFSGKETTQKAFALEQRARATPVFIFYDLQGVPVTRFTGPTQTPAEFLLLGRFVVDGEYKKQPFNIFKRQQQAK